jgi:hypothetical protein
MIKKIYFLFALLLIISTTNYKIQAQEIDPLEFQTGYPLSSPTALQQLESFPSPRYKKGNGLIRLFNWMNPNYMGGGGQPDISKIQSIETAFKIQEELILRWNYFIFIPNSTFAFPQSLADPKSPLASYVKLANKYPEIPLGTTIFWMQLQPLRLGYSKKKPNILLADHPDHFYVKDNTGKVIKRRLNFAAPDSLFIQDGQMQKQCLQNLLSHLTRPIDLINENGEEPPGVMKEALVSGDADMIADKNKLGISNWHIYMSAKKQYFRKLYSSQFMSLPELKNTWFTVYCVEGGPIDRFNWNSTKSTCSLIKGNYYSTPDFYPRNPNNWRTWKGPWHGWKWINDGRRVELKNGDRFFSPFIAAGWSNNPKQDIRPGQWLGLLKCLSVVGAEFYYVAYFNLKAPFSKPEDYVWQAAIPVYAQAITSRYTDVFKNGNVVFRTPNDPLITYPVNNNSDKDLLVAVRKHDQKAEYIIAATVQPESNTERAPLKKNAEITIDGTKILLKARRQGSVYFLDKSTTPYVFYQLDRWHQYEHPSHWRKEMIFEAEVNDTSSSKIVLTSVYDQHSEPLNLVYSETFASLKKDQWIGYETDPRHLEKSKDSLYVKLFLRGKDGQRGKISLNGWEQEFKITSDATWMWIIMKVPAETLKEIKEPLLKISSLSNVIEIDKASIGSGNNPPDLNEY